MSALAPVAILLDAVWQAEERRLQIAHDAHKDAIDASIARVEAALADFREAGL